MGTVILDMSMSLDGFIAGPKNDDNPEHELEALESLHDWMFSGKTEREVEVWQADYFKHTGAILMGATSIRFWGRAVGG